jgi:hypothetical protein
MLAVPASRDHARDGQPVQVLGDVGDGDAGPLGQLADAELAVVVQPAQEPQSRRIAEQAEEVRDVLEQIGRHHGHVRNDTTNHLVDQVDD